MALPNVTDLAAFLNMSAPGTEADELQQHLDAALAVVANRCGPLTEGTVTIAAQERRGVLVLDRLNLSGISQVRDPSGAVVEVDASAMNLRAGILTVPPRGAGNWAIDATTQTIPADLKLAVLVIAGHLWETQRGRSSRPGMLGPEDDVVVVAGYAVPNRAVELMAAHRLPVVA